ncbi:MAG: SIR2 family protein [Actinomycetota bacterium]|nr:SIR2 family protein [Actinomycetota bacterium]
MTPALHTPDDVDALVRELGLLDRTAANNLLSLRDRLLSLEKWALFVGAGVSKGVGLPTWNELTQRLAKSFGVPCPAKPADNAYPSILEECMTRAPCPEAFWEAVAEEVCRGEPAEIHELLMRLPFEAFLTLNLDCILDRSHGELRDVSEPRVVSYPNLQAVDVGGRRLIHLHGRCGSNRAGRLDEQSTVLTHTSYVRAYELSTLPGVIEATISAYCLLLVGTSLADWQVQLLLNQVRNRERLLAQVSGGYARPISGFAFVETDGTESAPALQWTWPGKVLGIEPIFYLNEDGRHTALLNTVRWLFRNTAEASIGRYEEIDP